MITTLLKLRLVSAFAVLAFAAGLVVPQMVSNISIQGHRGARGYVPENTIPSFIKGLDLGADTLEMDVVITSDRKVIVSHEAYFRAAISLDPSGRRIDPDDEKKHNIYQMTYKQTSLYDVGTVTDPAFPDQAAQKVSKPLLRDVFRAVERYAKQKGLRLPEYNIEIKSSPEGDGRDHPAPEEFVRLVMREISRARLAKRVIIQSFDTRPLVIMHREHPSIRISYLTSNDLGAEKNIEILGFRPDIYSPNFLRLDAASMQYCRAAGIKVIPWTVNSIDALERMKGLGVDGVISDYPDRARRLLIR